MFAVSGFATVAQNYISPQIASNFYVAAPMLGLLGAKTLGNNKKTVLNIGRPDAGEILSGKLLSTPEKKSIVSKNSYLPRIQGFKTNNSKVMGVRDTIPTVASASTSSHGQATQFAAKFNWTDLMTPCLIWHEDKIRAGQEGTKDGQAIAMGQLISEATEIAMQDHMDFWVDAIWNGNPADQTVDLWSSLLGIVQMLSTTNVYGNVDRSDGTNATWKSQLDSTLKAVDINKIVDDANLTKNIRLKGSRTGITGILTGSALFQQFKAQILGAGGSRSLGEKLADMPQMGMTGEILKKDNVLITCDPTCPANNVACFELASLKFITHPQRNFKMGKFVDLSENAEAAKDADQAQIRTRAMFTNDNPFCSVLYTAIGT